MAAYIARTNANPKPFMWTKTADDILASAARFCQRTSNSDHLGQDRPFCRALVSGDRARLAWVHSVVLRLLVSAKFQKPRPGPPKAEPAFRTLSREEREALAEGAQYVGSPHHTDVPKYGSPSNPRQGFVKIEDAEDQGLKNPACVVCPRKWVRRQADATRLVQEAIKNGNFISEGLGKKPRILWVRDPDDQSIVYEAKLASPPNGYKAYPLTSFQVEFNLPFEMP